MGRRGGLGIVMREGVGGVMVVRAVDKGCQVVCVCTLRYLAPSPIATCAVGSIHSVFVALYLYELI